MRYSIRSSPMMVLLLAVVLVPMATLATVLFLIARRVRKTFVISAQPRLIETQADHVPAELANVLGAVVPALEGLGFLIAANLHAPEFAPHLTWTQVLFIHRDRGDRASVLYLRHTGAYAGRGGGPTLAFATEFSD